MIRLAELGMFLVPLLALVAWRVAVARGLEGPPPRQLLAMLVGLVAVEAGLVTIAVRERFRPGHYVPAEMREGRIVPGHME